MGDPLIDSGSLRIERLAMHSKDTAPLVDDLVAQPMRKHAKPSRRDDMASAIDHTSGVSTRVLAFLTTSSRGTVAPRTKRYRAACAAQKTDRHS